VADTCRIPCEQDPHLFPHGSVTHQGIGIGVFGVRDNRCTPSYGRHSANAARAMGDISIQLASPSFPPPQTGLRRQWRSVCVDIRVSAFSAGAGAEPPRRGGRGRGDGDVRKAMYGLQEWNQCDTSGRGGCEAAQITTFRSWRPPPNPPMPNLASTPTPVKHIDCPDTPDTILYLNQGLKRFGLLGG